MKTLIKKSNSRDMQSIYGVIYKIRSKPKNVNRVLFSNINQTQVEIYKDT